MKVLIENRGGLRVLVAASSEVVQKLHTLPLKLINEEQKWNKGVWLLTLWLSTAISFPPLSPFLSCFSSSRGARCRRTGSAAPGKREAFQKRSLAAGKVPDEKWVKDLSGSYLVGFQGSLLVVAFHLGQPQHVVDRVSGHLQRGSSETRHYAVRGKHAQRSSSDWLTFPNMVCLLLSSSARPSVRKNWLLLSCGPAFAMATSPLRMKRSLEWNSSWKVEKDAVNQKRRRWRWCQPTAARHLERTAVDGLAAHPGSCRVSPLDDEVPHHSVEDGAVVVT